MNLQAKQTSKAIFKKEPEIPYKGRVLSKEEELAEENSIKLPKGKFARIIPVLGTLGFMFRNIPGGNEAIIRYMEIYISKQSGRKRNGTRELLHEFVIIWKNFDEFSKKRVDVFDWLCKTKGIDPCTIWGAISEGMFDAHEADIGVEIITAKTEVFNQARKFGQSERNFRDRELVAKTTKLIEEKGMEVNVDARTQVNNLQMGSSNFNSIIRQNEKIIREVNPIEKEVKELSETKQEFIDVESFQNSKEELYVSR